MTEEERAKLLDVEARRMVEKENELTRQRLGGKEVTLRGSFGVGGEPQEFDPKNPEHLHKFAPYKLKEMAKEAIVELCSRLVDKKWVTEWDIRNMLRALAPTFAKSKYYPGFGKPK